MPEAVFSSFLALGFDLLGWQADREAQQGAGRTDLQLRWNGSRERVLVVLKIWGRTGCREVHKQVSSYWTKDVVRAAVVMIADAEIDGWAAVYRETCLAPWDLVAEERPVDPPLVARFEVGGQGRVVVDHYLLRLPRRS